MTCKIYHKYHLSIKILLGNNTKYKVISGKKFIYLESILVIKADLLYLVHGEEKERDMQNGDQRAISKCSLLLATSNLKESISTMSLRRSESNLCIKLILGYLCAAL